MPSASMWLYYSLSLAIDSGCSKFLLKSAGPSHYQTSVSIRQKKAFGELYSTVMVGGCKLKVYRGYAHFQFFPYKFQLNENTKVLGVCWINSHDNGFCVTRNHWVQKLNHDVLGIMDHSCNSSMVYLFDKWVGPNTDHVILSDWLHLQATWLERSDPLVPRQHLRCIKDCLSVWNTLECCIFDALPLKEWRFLTKCTATTWKIIHFRWQ